jgi:hypothetical protein
MEGGGEKHKTTMGMNVTSLEGRKVMGNLVKIRSLLVEK